MKSNKDLKEFLTTGLILLLVAKGINFKAMEFIDYIFIASGIIWFVAGVNYLLKGEGDA